MTTFVIGTFNTLHGTAEIHPIADIVGWQEADTEQVRARIQSLDGYATYVPDVDGLRAIPISWREDVFELVDAGAQMTHAGMPKVSPHRGFSWVLLRHRATGELVLFVNTHFVSGAWSRPRTTTRWRRARWNEHMADLAKFVQHRRPDTVLVVGDMNRHEWLALPGLEHAATQIRAPYDQLHSTLPISGAQRGPKYGSDHHSWTAVVTLPVTIKEKSVSRTPMTDALVKELRRRGVEVLTQSDWGAKHIGTYLERLSTRPHALLPEKPVDTLWNHVSVTLDDGKTLGDFKADLRQLEDIGWERFGTGISYNVAVDQNAPRPRIAIGQFLEAAGAHTVNDKETPGYSYNQNKVALAVVWVGMPGDKLNEHAIEAMVQLRAALITIGALTDHYDDVPHSLVAWKDCPTGELRDRLPELKRRGLAAVKAAAAPKPPRKPAPTPMTDAAYEAAQRAAKAQKKPAAKAAWQKILDAIAARSSKY